MTNQIFDQPSEVSANNSSSNGIDALALLSEKSNTTSSKCRSLPDIALSSESDEATKCGPGAENHLKPTQPEITIKPDNHLKPVKPELTKEPEKGTNPENHHKPEMAEKPEMIEKQPVKPGLEETENDTSSTIAELLMDGSIDPKDQGIIEFAQSQANEEAGIKGEIELLNQINLQLENNNSSYRLRSGQNRIKTPGGRRLELVHQEARREIGSENEVLYQGVVDTFDFAI